MNLNPFLLHCWPIRATDVFPIEEYMLDCGRRPTKVGGKKRNKAKCKAQRKARRINC